MSDIEAKIRSAWIGRISGCQLGKPIERMSMRDGHSALHDYLSDVGPLPLRDYVGYKEGYDIQKECCRGFLTRSEPDDDIFCKFLCFSLWGRLFIFGIVCAFGPELYLALLKSTC